MLKLGITGVAGSGKSTVLAVLAELGISTADADKIAHEVYAKGTDGYQQVVAAFGEGILADDGAGNREISRARLGKLVFGDKNELARLTAITWPLILAQIERFMSEREAAGDRAVAVEAALLLEAGWAAQFDTIWIVDAPLSQIRARFESDARGASLSAMLKNQMPLAEKLGAVQKIGKPHAVIANDGDAASLRQQVRKAIDEYKIN